MGVATIVEEARGFDPTEISFGDESAHIAELHFGSDTPENRAKSRHGSGVIATFRRDNGQIFNASTCEWVHGLACRDQAVETITRNVPERACGQ